MKQLSDEWFLARKDKITASNAGAILGLSPYKNGDDVMREMVRAHFDEKPEFTGNIATDWGVSNEPEAVLSLENKEGVMVEKCGFIVSSELDFIGASPDGLVGADHVVEVKCPYNKKIFSLDDRADYYAQVQIQMYCSNRDNALFGVWTPNEFHSEHVAKDQTWLDDAIPVLQRFYREYCLIITNPDLSLPYRGDLVQGMADDKEWQALAARYLELKSQAEHAKRLCDDAKDQLIVMANGRKCKGAGVLVYPVKGRASTDYKRLVADHKIDVTKYQKTGKTSWAVKAADD